MGVEDLRVGDLRVGDLGDEISPSTGADPNVGMELLVVCWCYFLGAFSVVDNRRSVYRSNSLCY